MKRRHAAALALIGWYLMQTPIKLDHGHFDVDLGAPFSQWSITESFDTAAACKEAQSKWLERVTRQAQENPSNEVMQANGEAPTQCIATDDPRLKEKR